MRWWNVETFDRNGDNFKTCFFNNSFERVDNGANVNVVNLVRYLPHPDSGCKSQELGFHQFQTVEGRKWQENRFLFFFHATLVVSLSLFSFSFFFYYFFMPLNLFASTNI